MQKEYLLVAGDLFPSDNNIEYFANGDINSVFSTDIIDLFRHSSFSICNLEGSLSDSPETIKKIGPSIFAPSKSFEAIKKMGVKCLALANNHFMDAGRNGCINTLDILDKNGIAYIGVENKKSFFYISKKIGDKNVAIYNVAETMFNQPMGDISINLYKEYDVCKQIKELKSKNDYVIVIYHGGTEYFQYPTEELRRRFHLMADCGADVVTAQHTHCIGCEEQYNDTYLLYGQGNFLFARQKSTLTKNGILLRISFSKGIKIEKIFISSDSGYVSISNDSKLLSSFEKRCSHLYDLKFIESQYTEFTIQRYWIYLKAFRGDRIADKIIRMILGKKIFFKYILTQYSKHNILKMLDTLRSEQHREEAIRILDYMSRTK